MGLWAPFVELVALTILAARYSTLSFSQVDDCPFFSKLSGWTDNIYLEVIKLSFETFLETDPANPVEDGKQSRFELIFWVGQTFIDFSSIEEEGVWTTNFYI